jgi:hypothetical protein
LPGFTPASPRDADDGRKIGRNLGYGGAVEPGVSGLGMGHGQGFDKGTTKLQMDDSTGHLQCHFCGAYEVDRLFIGSLRVDSCTCQACGARWDEDVSTGRYRGRGGIESVMAPRDR